MKRIKKYMFLIIIVVIGLLDLGYGIYTWHQKETFIKSANTTKGYIYTISKNKNNQLLYVNYYISNKKYDGLIVTSNKKINIGKPITIYYDKKNPTQISDGKVNHSELLIILLGLAISIVGLSFILFKYKKQIEK